MEDLLQLNAVSRSHAQAAADEVLALVGEPRAEFHLSHADLLILLEGNVAAHHVIEKDAQRPDGGGIAMVAGAADPLRRSIDSRT